MSYDSWERKSSALLVHGCHLYANQWDRIIWGEPPSLLGRFPKAVLVAMDQNVETVIFGTGASEIGGIKEGAYILNYGLERWHQLSDFALFQEIPIEVLDKFKIQFTNMSIAETDSVNTVEEVTNALQICSQKSVSQLYQLSSPTHISRCIRDAMRVITEQSTPSSDNIHKECTNDKKCAAVVGRAISSVVVKPIAIYAVSSDTCYANSSITDVVIVEPPHRGDGDNIPLHLYAKRMLLPALVGVEQKNEILEDLDRLLEKYEIGHSVVSTSGLMVGSKFDSSSHH